MSIAEPGHPLFLTEDSDDDPVAVSEIQIARVENGQQVFYPRLFPANELQSLEQVAAELGGGSYILIARHEGRITTRRKYVLPGKPKPMYDEGRQENVKEPTPATSIDPMIAMLGGGQGGFMPLIMLMMQQQQQAADRQMQMFLAMMENTRSSSAEDKAAARAEMQANIERERINSERMMQMMQTAMQSRPSGGDSSAGFTQGVEFMRAFAQQQIEVIKAQAKGNDDGPDWGSLIETFGLAMQTFGVGKGGSGGLPEGIPSVVAGAAEAAQ